MRYHDLHYGAASLIKEQGVPVGESMEILDHDQISATINICAHIAPELQREATDKMEIG